MTSNSEPHRTGDGESEVIFLTGASYPWLCNACQCAVNHCGSAVCEGPDTDDAEAPCNLAYDLRLFCGEGGRSCTNPPEAWVRAQLAARLEVGDVVACPSCSGYSAFSGYVAENLRIPVVKEDGPRLDQLRCGSCGSQLLAEAGPTASWLAAA